MVAGNGRMGVLQALRLDNRSTPFGRYTMFRRRQRQSGLPHAALGMGPR